MSSALFPHPLILMIKWRTSWRNLSSQSFISSCRKMTIINIFSNAWPYIMSARLPSYMSGRYITSLLFISVSKSIICRPYYRSIKVSVQKLKVRGKKIFVVIWLWETIIKYKIIFLVIHFYFIWQNDLWQIWNQEKCLPSSEIEKHWIRHLIKSFKFILSCLIVLPFEWYNSSYLYVSHFYSFFKVCCQVFMLFTIIPYTRFMPFTRFWLSIICFCLSFQAWRIIV